MVLVAVFLGYVYGFGFFFGYVFRVFVLDRRGKWGVYW